MQQHAQQHAKQFSTQSSQSTCRTVPGEVVVPGAGLNLLLVPVPVSAVVDADFFPVLFSSALPILFAAGAVTDAVESTTFPASAPVDSVSVIVIRSISAAAK